MLCVGFAGAELVPFSFFLLPLEMEVGWAGGFFLHLEGNVGVNLGLDFCCSLCFVVPPLEGCSFFPPPSKKSCC